MTDPTRILLLTGKLSPAAGGLAVSVPSLAHNIDLFDDIEMHLMGTLDPADPNAAQSWGPRVQAFQIHGPAALQFAPDLSSAIAKLMPDLIDVQGLWTYPSRASLQHARRTNAPYIVTPRGMLDPWARQNSAWKKRLAGFAFQTAHLNSATCLRATAEMEAQHFREMGLTNPIAIVSNGIPLPELEAREDGDLRQLLFLSRIHPKKGLKLLLNSWAALESAFPDWEVVIAGIDENGHEADLKQLALQLNLKRLNFIGEKHGVEKQQQYRNADLFVLPTFAENFGLVVAEALAQETPVVTTTNAPWLGLKDHECGWCIDLDQTRLTETLRTALSLPATSLAEMGRRGRHWVHQDFSANEVAVHMHEVYMWAAGKAPKPGHVYD